MKKFPLLAHAILVLLSLQPSSSFAKVIQILHTNDLHASMNTSGAPSSSDNEHGGWAQVKAKLDSLRAEARAKGIDTLQLDAGDYTEGTLNYFPDQGVHVMKTFQSMGYDAAAIGNHDWLMGATAMNDLYGKAPFPFPILSANIDIDKRLTNLRKQVMPAVRIVKDGIRIGIVGLSTTEALYSWIPEVQSKKSDFKLRDYTDQNSTDKNGNDIVVPGIANQYFQELRKTSDIVIAMTHIGYDADKLLAKNSDELDLIVGGHSHTFLESANFVPNRNGKTVPIVQTGFNGHKIGKMLVEYDPNKTPSVQLLTYELVPVENTDPADPVIAAKVAEANAAVDTQFGPKLKEVLGTSEDRLISGDMGPTAYSQFAVDAMREATGAEIGIDVGAFHGNTPQAAGTVTRENLMMMYPRKFESSQNEGLYVYQARVPGVILKIGLKFALKFGAYVATSGITYDIKTLSDKDYAKLKKNNGGNLSALTPYYPDNMRVNGEKLKNLKMYTVSVPESLIRGAFGITSLTKLVLRHAERTSHTIWDSMSAYLTKIKVIKRAGPSLLLPAGSSTPLFNDKGDVAEMVDQTLDEMLHPSPADMSN